MNIEKIITVIVVYIGLGVLNLFLYRKINQDRNNFSPEEITAVLIFGFGVPITFIAYLAGIAKPVIEKQFGIVITTSCSVKSQKDSLVGKMFRLNGTGDLHTAATPFKKHNVVKIISVEHSAKHSQWDRIFGILITELSSGDDSFTGTDHGVHYVKFAELLKRGTIEEVSEEEALIVGLK